MLSVGLISLFFLVTATEPVFVIQTAIGNSTDNMPYNVPLLLGANLIPLPEPDYEVLDTVGKSTSLWSALNHLYFPVRAGCIANVLEDHGTILPLPLNCDLPHSKMNCAHASKAQ